MKAFAWRWIWLPLIIGGLAFGAWMTSVWLVTWLYNTEESVFGPWVAWAVGYSIPGLGLACAVAALWIVGRLLEVPFIRVGRRGVENLAKRIPVISVVFEIFHIIEERVRNEDGQQGKPVWVNFPDGSRELCLQTAEEVDAGVEWAIVLRMLPPLMTNHVIVLWVPKKWIADPMMTKVEFAQVMLTVGASRGRKKPAS